MTANSVRISRILGKEIIKPDNQCVHLCWIQQQVDGIEIDGAYRGEISNAIVFLNAKTSWRIINSNAEESPGYLLELHPEVLNNPRMSKLHINQVRIFNTSQVPIINLSPGIAKRTQAILEMIDELLGSELNHKEDAILSLLNTFFVYCDGQCNIKSVLDKPNAKNAIVYNFKKLVDANLETHHEVADYAELLNISPKYLNSCVKEVLGVTAKALIAEQLLMRSRNLIKFSDHTIKEISYKLGFSSPDYFSSFFKNHTGSSPSVLRKVL